MEKKFDPKKYEKEIYKMWEEGDYFKPHEGKTEESYSVILPPPNANGSLHVGHAMYVVEDLLVRWHRMKGDKTVWIPGTDHAGFETQYVFEKHLEKEGKTRLDFDRETFYNKVLEFVREHSGIIQDQVRKLGFSLDWSREKFTLDDDVISTVHGTFKKLHEDDLVYRGDYMVNYCTFCGTSLADLEVDKKEKKSPLYYITYYSEKEGKGQSITVATVRPETIFGDTAVAVNPEDERYKDKVGKEFYIPLTNKKIEVVEDDYVDPEFGTGALKITPAHDHNDFEIGQKHNLELIKVIEQTGKMNEKAGEFEGMYIKPARRAVVKKLKEEDYLEKVDKEYEHRVSLCSRCSNVIEPLVVPNWFIKVESLKKEATEAVKDGRTTIYPKRYKKVYLDWMDRMYDWCVSRQIAWGIRMPVWYSVKDNLNLDITFINSSGERVKGKVGELLNKYDFNEIEEGLQRLIAPNDATYEVSEEPPGKKYLRETDTYDTWFSSGQWPLVTLNYPDSQDFKDFYPTSVLETGYDILTKWVSRMMMLGLYRTGDVPFEDVFLHGLVTDKHGRKMSKSVGNVVNPLEMVDEYGADPLRMGLLIGSEPGSKFIAFDEDKVRGYRNFANKVWNVARFINIRIEGFDEPVPFYKQGLDGLKEVDKKLLNDLENLVESVNNHLENYKFKYAGEEIYHFMWEDLANDYLEAIKDRDDAEALSVLRYSFQTSLKLLHPYMPFVTEAIWKNMETEEDTPLIISEWPGNS